MGDNHKFNLDLEADSTKVDHIKDDPIKVSIKDDPTTKVSDNKASDKVSDNQALDKDSDKEDSVDNKEVSLDKFVPKQPLAVTGVRLPKAPIIVARATTRHPNLTLAPRS